MTLELWSLVFMGFFHMALAYLPAIAKIKAFNVIAEKNFSRDGLPQLTGKGARAERALANLMESLPTFVIVILVAHVTGSNNEWTQWGALMFVTARVLHPAFYILGFAHLRSISYLTAAAGIIMIAAQLA